MTELWFEGAEGCVFKTYRSSLARNFKALCLCSDANHWYEVNSKDSPPKIMVASNGRTVAILQSWLLIILRACRSGAADLGVVEAMCFASLFPPNAQCILRAPPDRMDSWSSNMLGIGSEGILDYIQNGKLNTTPFLLSLFMSYGTVGCVSFL